MYVCVQCIKSFKSCERVANLVKFDHSDEWTAAIIYNIYTRKQVIN